MAADASLVGGAGAPVTTYLNPNTPAGAPPPPAGTGPTYLQPDSWGSSDPTTGTYGATDVPAPSPPIDPHLAAAIAEFYHEDPAAAQGSTTSTGAATSDGSPTSTGSASTMDQVQTDGSTGYSTMTTSGGNQVSIAPGGEATITINGSQVDIGNIQQNPQLLDKLVQNGTISESDAQALKQASQPVTFPGAGDSSSAASTGTSTGTS